MVNINTSKFEECPLQQHSQCQKRPRTFKGPMRVVRLCTFGFLLPTILISLPLYLRYHVYANQIYPFAVSDMRLLDKRISTVWCQRQSVKVNATFNAFLLSQTPQVAPEQKTVSMVRNLVLEDDMKEYWGFYLLGGSSVTVSTCVRWPGASLIVIRGHKHLHECAYIGDDSSEELEEVLEAVRDGLYTTTINESSDSSAMANLPQIMKRHHPDIRFHHPLNNGTDNKYREVEELEENETTDPKLMRTLLEALWKKAKKRDPYRKQLIDNYNRQAVLAKNNAIRPTEVPKSVATEVNNDNLTSEELFLEVSKKLDALGHRQHKLLAKLNDRVKKNATHHEDATNKVGIDKKRKKRNLTIATALRNEFNSDDEERDEAIEEGFNSDGIADHRGFINETTLNDMSNSEFWSSFSSSEEALLNCNGLILNLPLTPHTKCDMAESEDLLNRAASINTITYIVPTNGYYFFVFNSENEVQQNYIRVNFRLNKTVYDVSHPKSFCSNKTDSCVLDLGFFSKETLVMEVPVVANESRWNEEFIVISECEPRTVIYVCCVISVPIIIILFAFQ